jgi:hypothetical protein
LSDVARWRRRWRRRASNGATTLGTALGLGVIVVAIAMGRRAEALTDVDGAALS